MTIKEEINLIQEEILANKEHVREFQMIEEIRKCSTGYNCRNIDSLFRAYQFENTRINQNEARITKRLIRLELLRRVVKALDILDEMEVEGDPKDTEKVNKFYEKQFLTGQL